MNHMKESAPVDETLQARVDPWLMACFGREISYNKVERGDRLLEEVFELLQSGGYDRARVLALRDYVWGREPGEPFQEVGGVMITLAAYCLAHDLNMHEAGETELSRIWTKLDKIRAKQAAKPTGSALPVAFVPHTHPEIPADIMKAATEIAYSAETGVVVGSFPGAVYIARAILAERQRFVADFDGAADAGIDAAVAAERERCREIAERYATSPVHSEAENAVAGQIADKIAGTL